MKSSIKKRWYFIFLVSVLSIVTYSSIGHIIHYEYWKHPIVFWKYSLMTLLQVAMWYSIIKRSPKLWMAIIAWSSLMLFDSLIETWYMLFQGGWSYLQYAWAFAYNLVFLTILIGGKKYIGIEVTPSQEFSN